MDYNRDIAMGAIMSQNMELFFVVGVLAFALGGSAITFYLRSKDVDSASKKPTNVLPHENNIKDYEANYEEEKHSA